MVNTSSIARTVQAISELMTENRDLLVKLDQVNGDGDLGISMDDGFRALADFFANAAPEDLGQAFREGSKVLNASAPSSLGTILSFGLMGMAKALRGQTEVDPATAASALVDGVENIMVKAESKPGEKTILDSLHPGAVALRDALAAEGASSDGSSSEGSSPDGSPSDGSTVAEATRRAAEVAAEGSEATKQMQAVHGRAAYSASRSIGILDGGSVVGKLIFEGIANAAGTEG